MVVCQEKEAFKWFLYNVDPGLTINLAIKNGEPELQRITLQRKYALANSIKAHAFLLTQDVFKL